MIAALAAAAFAASPGGFRLDAGVPVDMVQLRQVVAVSPGRASVAQTVVRAQLVTGRLGWDVQLPYVHTWAPGWSDDGLGQLRLGARRWTAHRRRPLSYGVELALPVAPSGLRVSAWGSAARETIPGVEGLMFLEVAAHAEAPFTFRAALGWWGGPYYDLGYFGFAPLLDLAVAQVAPIVGPLSIVGEAELLTDVTWLSARGLVRIDPARGWAFDLGVQVPVSAMFEREARVLPQAIGQARFFW